MIVFEGLENLDTTRCLLVLIIHEDEDGDDDCQVRDEVEARGRISAQGLWAPSLGLEPIFRARRPCYSRNFSHQPMLFFTLAPPHTTNKGPAGSSSAPESGSRIALC